MIKNSVCVEDARIPAGKKAHVIARKAAEIGYGLWRFFDDSIMRLQLLSSKWFAAIAQAYW